MKRKQALADLIAKVEAGEWDCNLPNKGVAGLGSAKRFRLAVCAYNGSLDAASALHEAVLPGWAFVIGPAAVHLWRNEDYGDPFCAPYEGKSDNPARAWLLAILRALHSMDPDA